MTFIGIENGGQFVAFWQQESRICCISNSKTTEFSSFRLSNPISCKHRAKSLNLVVRSTPPRQTQYHRRLEARQSLNNRLQHTRRLRPSFFVLGAGIRLNDHPAADGHLPPTLGRRDRAN